MIVNAVVPLRYADHFSADGKINYMLDQTPLWEYTFKSLNTSTQINSVVLAIDDPRWAAQLKHTNHSHVYYHRPNMLSAKNVSSIEVMQHVAKYTCEKQPDCWMLLEISHPIRPAGFIDQIIKMAINNPADAHVAVKKIKYNYWLTKGEGGTERIVAGGEDPGTYLYQELVGLGSLFAHDALISDDPFGSKTNLMPVDHLGVDIDIRDHKSYMHSMAIFKDQVALDKQSLAPEVI